MTSDETRYTFTLSVNIIEAGVLMGVIMKAEDHTRELLSGVFKQLVDKKKEVEQAEGVTKEVLPGGVLKISDADGNVIIREPYPWEIEGN
ncbi:hypothetical protein LCGC14_0262700 [marine sediment metagenome]|uniref:Uncharacterized protein n=1 Tax=marine sediment metagenome TaxID=412755 RepID=A0A0F9WLR9_9ZZZZ